MSRVSTNSWLAPLLLLLGVGLVFMPVLGFDFLNYDDPINVTANPFLLPGSTFHNLLAFWRAPYEKLYIPVTYSVWWLLAQLSLLWPPPSGAGPNPHLFHGANLLLHLGSAFFCQKIIKKLVNSESAGWAGALLFALHPVQVEAVAWVTGMKDLLAGFFALLSLWLYLRVASSRDGVWRWGWGGAFLAYGVALLAKPTVVGMPVAFALIAVFILRRPPRQVVCELLPWQLLALPVVWITKSGQADMLVGQAPALWWRPLIAGDTFSFYVAKLLFPFQLGADYGRTPQWLLSQSWFYLSSLACYGLAAILVWRFRRPWLLLPLALFSIPILPVSGLVGFVHQEISTVADRYLYLAMMGPALLAGYLFSRYPLRWVWISFIVLMGLWSVQSGMQVRSWRNSLVFNRHTLAVNPRSWTAHANLGEVLHEQGRPAEAMAELNEALRLAPDHAVAHKNLGVLLEEQGHFSEAKIEYSRAIQLRPDLAVAHYALGLLEAKLGNLPAAESRLRVAVSLRPYFADYHGNLGVVLYGSQQRAGAAREFAEALRLDPNSAGAHNGLGAIRLEEGKIEEAIDHFRAALDAEPGLEQAAENLRAALAKQQGRR